MRCIWDSGRARFDTTDQRQAATLSLANRRAEPRAAGGELPRALADFRCGGKSCGHRGRPPRSRSAADGSASFAASATIAESRAVVAGDAESLFGGGDGRIRRQVPRRRADQLRRAHLKLGRGQGILPQRQIGQDQRHLQSSRPRRRRCGAARPTAVVPARRVERHGRQCRAHFAQHADAGVGGGLRSHGHDDDVRDAPDEFESRRHGATGSDGKALSQFAVDHFVVDGQRRVDDDVPAAGPARDRRHDRAHPRTGSDAAVHGRGEYRFPDAISRKSST